VTVVLRLPRQAFTHKRHALWAHSEKEAAVRPSDVGWRPEEEMASFAPHVVQGKLKQITVGHKRLHNVVDLVPSLFIGTRQPRQDLGNRPD